MNQFQQAFQEAIEKSENKKFKKMTITALKRSKKKRRKKIIKKDPSSEYHFQLKKSAYRGINGYVPCSILKYPPGKAVEVNGSPGRVKWGLYKDDDLKVVVLYEHERIVEGKDFKSFYAIESVKDIKDCSCNGYLHKGSCKPKKGKID